MASPGFSESAFHALRSSSSWLSSSTAQVTDVFPGTIIRIWTWGLDQSTRVTIPLIVVLLFVSNFAATGRCAAIGITSKTTAIPRGIHRENFPDILNASQNLLLQSARRIHVPTRMLSHINCGSAFLQTCGFRNDHNPPSLSSLAANNRQRQTVECLSLRGREWCHVRRVAVIGRNDFA